MKIHYISKTEIGRAASTLAESFEDDPLLTWIFGGQDNYNLLAEKFFHGCIKYCVIYGYAMRTDNFESVAIRKKPGDLNESLWKLLRSGLIKTPKLLGKDAFERLMLFEKQSIAVKLGGGIKNFLYCWMIGTRKEYRCKGYGSQLMKHTFHIAKEMNVPCLLEVSSEQSKKIHLHKGYTELSKFLLQDSNIDISIMIK